MDLNHLETSWCGKYKPSSPHTEVLYSEYMVSSPYGGTTHLKNLAPLHSSAEETGRGQIGEPRSDKSKRIASSTVPHASLPSLISHLSIQNVRLQPNAEMIPSWPSSKGYLFTCCNARGTIRLLLEWACGSILGVLMHVSVSLRWAVPLVVHTYTLIVHTKPYNTRHAGRMNAAIALVLCVVIFHPAFVTVQRLVPEDRSEIERF